MKKIGKIILITLIIPVGLLLISIFFIYLKSPGKLNPLKNESGQVIENSLTEKSFIEIGGIQQGFFIRSEHTDNPVILFLHGGPGSPELPLIMPYEKAERLEKYFTVCYWDQRCAGMTFSKDTDLTSLTVEQYVEDTRQMTNYLKERFGKDKIYLMGHSWGSYLGIKTIERHPELYAAYIGIGQVTNQLLSEQLAYDYMLKYAKEHNDSKIIKKLEKVDKNASDFPTINYLTGIRASGMNKYGIGIKHNDFSMAELFKDIFFFKGYTLTDKMHYGRGNFFSLNHVFHYVTSDNLFNSSNVFEVPVYVIHGLYDYQVSQTLAKEYIDEIEAPDKAFYSFENSAHSPNIEEPERFVQVVKDIVNKQ